MSAPRNRWLQRGGDLLARLTVGRRDDAPAPSAPSAPSKSDEVETAAFEFTLDGASVLNWRTDPGPRAVRLRDEEHETIALSEFDAAGPAHGSIDLSELDSTRYFIEQSPGDEGRWRAARAAAESTEPAIRNDACRAGEMWSLCTAEGGALALVRRPMPPAVVGITAVLGILSLRMGGVVEGSPLRLSLRRSSVFVDVAICEVQGIPECTIRRAQWQQMVELGAGRDAVWSVLGMNPLTGEHQPLVWRGSTLAQPRMGLRIRRSRVWLAEGLAVDVRPYWTTAQQLAIEVKIAQKIPGEKERP